MAYRFARLPVRAASMRDLSACDFRVLISIAAHADADGRAYPSMATVAKMTGIRRQDVPRSVKRLEQAGLLRRDARSDASAANVYTVVLDVAQVSATLLTDGVRDNADRASA